MYEQQIRDWIETDGLQLANVHGKLARRGVQVPYPTLHRFATERCGFGRRRPGVDVALLAPSPQRVRVHPNTGTDPCHRGQHPRCGGAYTHVDGVFVAGRPREDGDVLPVYVNSTGRTKSDSSVSLPIPDVGRRHAISLKGWCETCAGHFAIEFVQQKGTDRRRGP